MINKYAVILSGILLIVILLILLLDFFKKDLYENIEAILSNGKENAIVVLTRGYENIEKYEELINRNDAIYEVYYNKLSDPDKMDVIIFHEGNINDEHQAYIKSRTPKLPLQFIAVNFYNNTNTNERCPPTNLSSRFDMGYKNMCYFWSIDFLHYLKNYKYIIRIDEDCIIRKLDPNILDDYGDRNILYSFADFNWENNIDDPDVIIGLRELFEEFMEKNDITPYKSHDQIRCPYTNFMIVNIESIYNNKVIMSILNEIEKSNCIFSNRWGDLPIWGYILSLLVDEKYYLKDENIKYRHGSHDIEINI